MKLYTSRPVIEELEKTKGDKREKMLGLISTREIPVLETSVEAEKLADIYVAENVIPVNYRTDGLHIAIAAVNDLDMIISMNFQHIVKRKTIKMTAAINSVNGYRAVEIYSPMVGGAEMKNNNAIEQDINRIRLEIYEETKGMTPEQRVEHTRKATDETIKKYGFKVIERVPHKKSL